MLQKDIEAKFLEAYKAKDEVRVGTLRMLKTSLVNKMIEKKMAKTDALPDEEVIAVIKSEIKRRQDSIEAYNLAKRADLADKESAEVAVLSQFMPEQMSEDQVRQIVKETIAEMNAAASDFGKVMGAVMARAKGQTDGSVVSRLVKEELK